MGNSHGDRHLGIYKNITIKIMATLTNEQIEQKKQKLSEILKEAKVLQDELVEAGAIPMDDDELDGVAGGRPGGGIGVGAYGPSDSFGLH